MAFKIKFKQMRSGAGSTADGGSGDDGGGVTPQNSPRQGPLPSPRRSPSPSKDEDGNTKLFVRNLSRDIQDYHVEGLFSQYVRVRNVYMKGKVGFVEFYDPQDADDARCELNEQEFGWSHITVEFAMEVQHVPEGPYALGRYNFGLYEKDYGSKNCRNSHTDLGRRINRSYRRSCSRSTRLQDEGSKRNFGCAEFSDPRDAYDARYDLDGRKFDGRRVSVECATGVLHGPGGVRQHDKGPSPDCCYNCGMDGHWVRDCKCRQGRSYSMSPSPRHGKKRGRSYSRSPSPRHGKDRSRTYRRDYRNAGGEEVLSRRSHHSPNPRRSLPPRGQDERNDSYHGRSPRRGEARGKRQ